MFESPALIFFPVPSVPRHLPRYCARSHSLASLIWAQEVIASAFRSDAGFLAGTYIVLTRKKYGT